MSHQCPCLPAVAVQRWSWAGGKCLCMWVCASVRSEVWDQLLRLIFRVGYPSGKSLQIEFGMQREKSSLIYKNRKSEADILCSWPNIMLNENALNVISEWIKLFFVHAWIQYIYLFFSLQIWQQGRWGRLDDRLMFLTLIKRGLYCRLNETFLGFDVGLFEHWIIVSLEENNLIRQHNFDKSSLSFMYINSKSVTLWFIHSYVFF